MGPRLKLARAAMGLSLRDLSNKIGNRVTAQAIGKYERQESVPGSAVLMALSKALGVSVDYLVSEQDLALDGVEFRKKKITSKREEARVEATVLHMLERYLMVEEFLGLDSVEWQRPHGAPYPLNEDAAEAENAARIVRDHWGLGVDPIRNFTELLEERGIKVLSIDDEKIDGLTARVQRPESSPLPVIVINRNDWAERKRFNLAHELGHMFLKFGPKFDDHEKAAHRFAGAFLMPPEALWAEIGKHRNSISIGELVGLKKIFGASIQAITYRCKDLGIISNALYRRIFGIISRRGWRSFPYKEPGAMDSKLEEPMRFERLCFRALSEDVISEARVSELLEIPIRELHQRMEGVIQKT